MKYIQRISSDTQYLLSLLNPSDTSIVNEMYIVIDVLSKYDLNSINQITFNNSALSYKSILLADDSNDNSLNVSFYKTYIDAILNTNEIKSLDTKVKILGVFTKTEEFDPKFNKDSFDLLLDIFVTSSNKFYNIQLPRALSLDLLSFTQSLYNTDIFNYIIELPQFMQSINSLYSIPPNTSTNTIITHIPSISYVIINPNIIDMSIINISLSIDLGSAKINKLFKFNYDSVGNSYVLS